MGNNFYLNSLQYTVYPKEAEVLLDDGLRLQVNEVTKETDDNFKNEINIVKLTMIPMEKKLH